jgi:hypothetical protein
VLLKNASRFGNLTFGRTYRVPFCAVALVSGERRYTCLGLSLPRGEGGATLPPLPDIVSLRSACMHCVNTLRGSGPSIV